MPDGTEGTSGPSSDKGQASDGNQSPSQLTITPELQAHIDSLLRERHSKLDKELAARDKTIAQITKERDTFKTRLSEAETATEAASATVKDLEKDLEAAVDGNADQSEILKLKRELRGAISAKEAALKKERLAFEEERQSHAKEWESKADKIKKADEAEWDGIVAESAKAVEGDAKALKDAAAELGISTKEQLQTLAKRLYPTKPLIDGEPASLETRGGRGKLTPEAIERMSMEDYANDPSVKARFK